VESARLKAVVHTLAVALAVVVAGTLGYIAIEGMTPLDALYMTVITVTTIGFREVQPMSDAGRVFTMVMAFVGIGFILIAATEIGRAMLQGDLRELIGLRRDQKMTQSLRQHIVVCGYGRTGRAVVEVLQGRRVPFVIVEAAEDAVRRLRSEGVPVVQGDATRKEVLREARVEHARTFLACLSDDAHNVFAILLARQLNPELAIIARAVEEGSEDRLRLAGAHRVINPYRLGGMRLAYTAIKPTVTDFVEASMAGTSVELELAEIVVHPSSELAGKTLASAEVRRRFGIIVVALKRGETSHFNPAPDMDIEAGDVLVALGPTQALERVERASQ
jgi:voltage-gated potassium channel